MNTNERRIESRENILKVMDKTFVMIPTKLLRDVADGKITSSAFALYCYLLFRQGTNAQYWGSIEDVCWGTGISPAQVSRLLKQLVEAGHILRTKRVGTTWITRCLTRVHDQEIIFHGRPVSHSFSGGRSSDTITTEPDQKKISRAHRETHAEESASENEIAEAVDLFEKELCRSRERSDQVRRELGLDSPPPRPRRMHKQYYSNVSDHY